MLHLPDNGKSGRIMGEYLSYLDFEKAYYSDRRKYCTIFSLNLVYL
jgi:hypothetical protein